MESAGAERYAFEGDSVASYHQLKAASGKPEIRLHGALAEWFAQRRLVAHVSVTDENDYAATFVVVETQEIAP